MDKATVEKYFNENSGFWISNSYEKLPHTYPTALDRLKKTLALVQKYVPAKGKTVDLGCGGGHLCAELASRGYQATGMDLSEKMVQQAKAYAGEKLDEKNRSNIQILKGNITESGLPSSEFDLAASLGVIGYLPDDAGLFKEASRLLKPGGLFILSCRNRLFNFGSVGNYAIRELEQDQSKELIEEILELSQQPVLAEDTKAFLAELKKASDELLVSELAHDPKKSEKPAKPTFAVEPRQHTPKQLKKTAESHGFQHELYLGVHPHLLNARVNQMLPSYVFNTLSASLDVLSHHPVSLIWSSVILGVFRKK